MSVMWLVSWVIEILRILIIVDAILSWIPSIDRRNALVVMLRSVTEPILRPIRRLIPPQRTGYVDLSPLIAIIGLSILESILASVLR